MTIAQSGIYLFERDNTALLVWCFGLPAIALGATLVLGFLTPISSSLVLLVSISNVLLNFEKTNFDWAIIFYTIAVSAAVILLGPGAFSIDARMFGRREIIIPGKSDFPHN